jgi:HK97 family phage major capsid protein
MKLYQLIQQRSDLSTQIENLIDSENYTKGQLNSLNDKFDSLTEKIESKKKLDSLNAQANGTIIKKAEKIKDNQNVYSHIENLSDKYLNSFNDTNISLNNYLKGVTYKPQNSHDRAIIDNSVTSDGYVLPVRVASEIIDKLRLENPVVQAGAKTVTLEGGTTKYITIDNYPKSVWHSEMEDVSAGSGSFGSLEMKPKTVLSLVEVSRELLQDSDNMLQDSDNMLQDSDNIGQALSEAFVGSINESVIDATFNGTGGTEPKGLNTTVSQAETYSGSATYSNVINAVATLENQNVSNYSIIYSPDFWKSLNSEKDSNDRYQQKPSFLNDVQTFVSSELASGTAWVGDFSKIYYGYKMNFTLETYKAPLAQKFGALWLAGSRLDILCTHPNAFIKISQ